ncbi:unnamed protein product [Boreogadus saida]
MNRDPSPHEPALCCRVQPLWSAPLPLRARHGGTKFLPTSAFIVSKDTPRGVPLVYPYTYGEYSRQSVPSIGAMEVEGCTDGGSGPHST